MIYQKEWKIKMKEEDDKNVGVVDKRKDGCNFKQDGQSCFY